MKKLYYSIGDVSRMTGLESHVLRYWESVFPMLRPSKSRSGSRRYREQDVQLVLRIQDLVHRQRYSTAGALKVLRDEMAAQRLAETSTAGADGSVGADRGEPAGGEGTGGAGGAVRQGDMFDVPDGPVSETAGETPVETDSAEVVSGEVMTGKVMSEGAVPSKPVPGGVMKEDAQSALPLQSQAAPPKKPGDLTPEMRLELLTIREFLRRLRDLL